MIYRILIAEDEQIARNTIVNALEGWSQFALTLRQVNNGEDGVAEARAFRPHVVITDIMMPRLDGLQMIEQIRSFLPQVRCLILSGYSDFEFARGALELKVSSYLLKPFNDEELFEKLAFLFEEIGRARRLERFVNEPLSPRRHEMLCALLNGHSDQPAVELLREAGLDAACTHVGCVAIRVIALTPGAGDDFLLESQLFLQDIFMPGRSALVHMNDERTALALLYGSPTPLDCAFLQREMDRYRGYIRRHTGAKLLIGIGGQAQPPAALPAGWRLAGLALNMAFFSEDARPVCLHTPPADARYYAVSRLQVHQVLEQMSADISAACLARDTEQAAALLDQMQRLMHTHSPMGIDTALDECERLLFTLFSSVGKLALQDYRATEERFCQKIRECTTLGRVFDVLREALWQADTLLPGAATSENQIVASVKSMIEREYARGITLSEIADALNLTPNYLGSLFSRSAGVSFNSYLNEYRIQQARRLLRETDLPMRRIAQNIGLGDVTYFSTLFKKLAGMTPSVYRKLKR